MGRLRPNPKATLRQQVHEVMRFFHYSDRTEETYWQWMVRYLKFHRRVAVAVAAPQPGPLLDRGGEGDETDAVERVPTAALSVRGSKFDLPSSLPAGVGGVGESDAVERVPTGGWRHPREMGAEEVASFLSHLASELKVSGSTQNQALNAVVFLYSEVLHQPLGEIGEFARVQRPARLPEVLSRAEVAKVLGEVEEDYRLPLSLLYGTGMRLFELLRLRVKELDLERRQITVRDGKGCQDRVTMLPESLRTALAEHLKGVRAQWEVDVKAGYAGVWLPDALARKYTKAPKEWPWQWVFPSWSLTAGRTRPDAPDHGTGRWRHHLSPENLQRAMRMAMGRAELNKRATPHRLRHSFATPLL